MSRKSNATIGFEKQIWDSACELWGIFQQQSIESNYRTYFLAIYFWYI